MDRGLIIAVALLALGTVLTIGASSLGLMGHYEAKVFVVVGGLLSLLVLLATERRHPNGS